MDRLSSVFSVFVPQAEVVHAGHGLKASLSFEAPQREGAGYLHLTSGGPVALYAQGERHVLEEPSALFLPLGPPHRLEPLPGGMVDLVSARVAWGHSTGNPFLRALPAVAAVPLTGQPRLRLVAEALLAEAVHRRCGHAVALDRLSEYVLIVLLRHLLETRRIEAGLLAGLSDARLMKALAAMHDSPQRPWTLEQLADEAGMSRARFAEHFRGVVGSPPLAYLTEWRFSVAQALLRQGRPLKAVVRAVGYQDTAAFTRAFTRRLGMPPSRWLQAQG